MSLQLKSKKQHIRLWFEFYRLCTQQKEFEDNLKKSHNFYKPWGDVSNIKFDDWWNDHKELFGPSRVEEINRLSKHPNSLNVVIPLNMKPKQIMDELKSIIETKQIERLNDIGVNHQDLKSLDSGFGDYEISGKEPKWKSIQETLWITQLFYEKDKPPINKNFLIQIHEFLKSRPKSKITGFRSINENLHKYTSGQLENEIRVVRRNKDEGIKILKNVSQGRFP